MTAEPVSSQQDQPKDRPEGSARGFSLPNLSRRQILIGGGGAAGLVLAWALWPRSYAPNLAAADNEEIFGAYLKISREGLLTVAVPQCEMGQGVFTVLPQILAGELGADWRTVAVEPAPVNPLYANSVLAEQWAETILPAGADKMTESETARWLAANVAMRNEFIVTADSATIPAYEQSFRDAGAAARVLLCKAAAEQWDVAWEACRIENGLVLHEDKSLRFGELVEDAARQTLPDPVPLRPSPENNLVGQDVPRLDLPSKLDGSANFAGDVRLPDMVYASLRQGPIGDTTLKSFNREAASKMIGLVDVVENERWLAAVATNWWAANRALDLMAPVFETRGLLPNSGKMDSALEEALDSGPGVRFLSKGNTEPVFAEDISKRALYEADIALHAPIETQSATAEFKDGRLQIWLATQAPVAAIAAAARAIGISEKRVTLYPMLSGGSFGRNLDCSIAAQVAVIAEQLGRPVQLTWSRAEDMMHSHYRAPAHARIDAATDEAGRIQALQVKVAAPAAAREQSKRLFSGSTMIEAMQDTLGEPDSRALDGAEIPYNIPNVTVDHHPAYVGVPTGNWRSNASSYNAFFVESFIDEMASRAGVEPLSYRMQMLTGQPRLARCLTGVAAMAGWDGGLDGSGQGIACHMMHGAHIAVIASASRGEGGLTVRRISATVDIGRIIHPDIARQQIEGGIVFGLAMAMGASTKFEDGLPTAKRLRDLSLPRLAEVPDVQVEFIKSDEEPAGVEEIGVPAVAPAIANALFSATGVRFRQLPLFSEAS